MAEFEDESTRTLVVATVQAKAAVRLQWLRTADVPMLDSCQMCSVSTFCPNQA
jgi:hypothetical protein